MVGQRNSEFDGCGLLSGKASVSLPAALVPRSTAVVSGSCFAFGADSGLQKLEVAGAACLSTGLS